MKSSRAPHSPPLPVTLPFSSRPHNSLLASTLPSHSMLVPWGEGYVLGRASNYGWTGKSSVVGEEKRIRCTVWLVWDVAKRSGGGGGRAKNLDGWGGYGAQVNFRMFCMLGRFRLKCENAPRSGLRANASRCGAASQAILYDGAFSNIALHLVALNAIAGKTAVDRIGRKEAGVKAVKLCNNRVPRENVVSVRVAQGLMAPRIMNCVG